MGTERLPMPQCTGMSPVHRCIIGFKESLIITKYYKVRREINGVIRRILKEVVEMYIIKIHRINNMVL